VFAALLGATASHAQTEPRPAQDPAGTTLPVAGPPLATGLPGRHQGTRLSWDPAFNRVDTPELILTGAAVGVALAANILPPRETGWKGGVLFDDDVRRALRLSDYQVRLNARDMSDVGLALITAFPVIVDSLIVAYWYRGSDDVALQMTLIDAEAFAITAALQGAATYLGGRARPYSDDCGGEVPEKNIDCQSHGRYRSFFSGHTAHSFTSASLMCAHHMSLSLFESGADAVTCVSGFVAAGAIGTLRIAGDMHYASDVATGALVGTAVGLGVPLLHHYKRRAPDDGARSTGAIEWNVIPLPTGVQIVGAF
jgi:membrane-associated phospholipid phosphatase